MDLWGWVIAYAVVFVLVQLLVYVYYLRRGDGADHSVRPAATGDPGQYGRRPSTLPDHDADAGVEDGRRCPNCGARNEAVSTFSYCRNCAESLGA